MTATLADVALPDGVGGEIDVLWRSDTVIAVNKPSGWLVHNSGFAGPKERSLRQAVGAALGRRVFPVHRLDRGTSGVLLFALESEFVARWQAALGDGECSDAPGGAASAARKHYLALVRGTPAAVRVDYAVNDSRGVPRDAVSEVAPLESSPVERVSLAAIALHTGRHHQARRHFAHLRHPIVNDAKHGNSKFNRELRASSALEHLPSFTRLALHASTLHAVDPFTGEPVRLSAPVPGDLAAPLGALFPGVDLAAIAEGAAEALP